MVVNREDLKGEVLGVESDWTSSPHPLCLGFRPACCATVEQTCLVSRLIYGLGVFNMLLPYPSKTQHHKITQGSKLPESFSQNTDLK